MRYKIDYYDGDEWIGAYSSASYMRMCVALRQKLESGFTCTLSVVEPSEKGVHT